MIGAALLISPLANQTMVRASGGSVGQLSVVAGTTQSLSGSAPQPGPLVPTAVAVDSSAGDLFVVDHWDETVDEINASGDVSLIAGVPGQAGLPTPGPATASHLDYPSGVAVDALGDVFIADSYLSTRAGRWKSSLLTVSSPSVPGSARPSPARPLYIADTGNDPRTRPVLR